MPEKKVTFVPLEKALAKKKSEPKEEEEKSQPEQVQDELDERKVVETHDEESKEEDKEKNRKSKITILVAEDEKPLSRALELKLTNQGYNALTAFDGEEAIEMLQKNDIDLVILDIVMPKLDGFGVLQKLKELKIKTKVVVISNLSQDEDKDKAIKLGATEYFIKSDIPISDIVNFITKTLNA